MSEDKKEMNIVMKFCRHLHTIDAHRFAVMKNCFKCGLYCQGLLHDLSKYSPQEFWESVKYFQGDCSPYRYEREHFGYAAGWLHHKGRNKHHWEYWYDDKPLEMPFNYFVEMICDRIGACRIYEKENYTKESALNYYLASIDRKFLHPVTAQMLEDVLRDISVRGEDAVFSDLKIKVKEWRRKKEARKLYPDE